MEQQTAEIRYDLIEDIQSRIQVPLVLHGSTGVPDDDLKKIVKTNFGKVNIGTAIRMAFGNTLRYEMENNPNAYDRIDLFQAPIQAVKQEAKKKIELLNAHTYELIER